MRMRVALYRPVSRNSHNPPSPSTAPGSASPLTPWLLSPPQVAISKRQPFSLRLTVCGGGGAPGVAPLQLVFRPATGDHIGEHTSIPLIGIPNFVDQEIPASNGKGNGKDGGSSGGSGGVYYFAVVQVGFGRTRTLGFGRTRTLHPSWLAGAGSGMGI
jgi:hypothetical protein